LSGEYPRLLRRRAESMLRLARRLLDEGEYDLAALHAEYSIQLAVKSILYRLTGEEWRGHAVRTLLGALLAALEEAGLRGPAEELAGFIRSRRRLLAELEEAHVRAVYGALPYSRRQAEALVGLALELWGLLSRLEAGLLGAG
jgi:HEPN domain-containing protein